MRSAVLAIIVLGGCARGGIAAGNEDLDAPRGPDAPGAPPRPDARPDAPPAPPDAPPVPPDAPPPPPPPACVPMTTQLLASPLFDHEPPGAGWIQQPIDPAFPLVTAQDGTGPGEHTAPYKAWLGGFKGANVRDSLYQEVVVPPLAKQVSLSGVYQVRTDESSNSVYDSATVALTLPSGAVIATVLQLSNLTTQAAWTSFNQTVTQNLSGQTVRVRFSSRNDSSNPTSFFFDTLALTVTHGCP